MTLKDEVILRVLETQNCHILFKTFAKSKKHKKAILNR